LQILLLEFEHIAKILMTLPSQGKKLTVNEIESINIALKDCGIRAIHPEKMESFAEYLVSKLKGCNNSN